MQRLTISLDDDLAEALDEMQDHGGDSKANLVRRALRSYLRRQKGTERPTEFDLRVWTELLSSREHVILDVAHARLLFEQCSATATPEFWAELRLIGEEHAVQYRDKGISKVEDVLKIIEAANWFHVAKDSDQSWALVFTEPSAKPFLKAFLGGWFADARPRVELIDERTKLRVRYGAPVAAAQR